MPQPESKSRRNFLKGAALVGSAAAVAGCANSGQDSTVAVTGREKSSFYPKHNERTKGWLRFIWEKATTADDWSYRGDEELPWGIKLQRGPIDFSVDGKGPHPWWDQYSTAPFLSYPRFDLSDSSYPILLMAEQTPAWREVYTRVMDEMATRHTAYWAAIDWNTFIGPSPDRANYPQQMMAAWPERVRGNYDFPGWTANGVEPWGLQRDPIGADGNLFFRGWLNLVLSIYKYVSGDDKWERPWQIAGYENEHFEWTQPRIVEHLRQQYVAHPEGPHCENTKIWPLCNSAAGLGIYLSDQLGMTNAHGVFENWVEFARDNYMGVNSQNQLEWSTAYYDPIADFKVNGPGAGGGVGVAFYLLPQSPEIGTFLYDSAANALGWRDPRQEIRPSSQGLAIARSLGDNTVADRLSAAAERDNEPKFFGDNMDRFGWGFNLNEPWPRGQGTAQMMISEIAEGSWADSFKVKHLDKYSAPTLEGVDFPNLGVDQAWNDKDSGTLHISTYVVERSHRGQETSWRITGLPDANEVVVLRDGSVLQGIEVLNATTVLVRTVINNHQYQIYTGYRGQQSARVNSDPALKAQLAASTGFAAHSRTAADTVKAAESVMAAGSAKCPCCATT